MSHVLEYLSTPGEWVERWSGDGGNLRVVCSRRRAEHTGRCWLLGRFHHHGVFTPATGNPTMFVGQEGADYPSEVLDAFDLSETTDA